MKKTLKITLCFLFLFTISYGYLEFWAHQLSWGNQEKTLDFSLKPGESLSSFTDKIVSKGLVNHGFLFKFYIRLRYSYKKFQAGQYRVSLATSPAKLIQMVSSGAIYEPVSLKFTVVEGENYKLVLQKLERKGYSGKALEGLSQDQRFIKSLGISAQSLEGYLYPSTYSFFYKKPHLEEVFRTMVGKFFKSLPANYLEDLGKRGLSLHQGVIIASLIEKETALSSEKPFIAEIIQSRLKKRMHLGIDASTIYGIEGFDGNLTQKHLQDKRNSYNTRVHYGLPPGPIGSPSHESLKSVVNPSNKGYFYYVLKPGMNQKEHHFSKTFFEHKIYVQKLKESQISIQ